MFKDKNVILEHWVWNAQNYLSEKMHEGPKKMFTCDMVWPSHLTAVGVGKVTEHACKMLSRLNSFETQNINTDASPLSLH